MYIKLQVAGRLQASCLVSTDSSGRQPFLSNPSSRPRQAPSRHRLCDKRSIRRLISIQAIGFDLGTETGKGTDKHADNLTRAASSLLLYQNVLKNRPAQAFLKLLLYLQKGRVQDILEAYGEFYSSLAAGNYLSWQDFLLEEVLNGKANSFARAAARGELPKSSPLHKAAAFDLDILQKLAVAETTLVSWVEDTSRSLPEGWAAAAAAYGPSTNPELEAAKSEAVDIPSELSAPAYIKGPLTASQRTAYRASIGGKWKWAEALPELQYYYEAHGFGITAVNSHLQWRSGYLEAYEPPECSWDEGRWDTYKGAFEHELLGDRLERFFKVITSFMNDTGSAQNMLSSDDCLAPALIWEWQKQQQSQHNIRFVRLMASDLSQLSEVAHTLQQYPRVKFVLYCDSVIAVNAATAHGVMRSTLKGVDWPKNAMFCASWVETESALSEVFDVHV